MKLRWKITGILVAAGVVGVVLLLRPDSGAQKAVEEARHALRQEGFKTDLTEFNFSTSSELRAREIAITNTERGWQLGQLVRDRIDLTAMVGSNSALVVWTLNKLPTPDTGGLYGIRNKVDEDLWSALQATVSGNQTVLDAAREAALSGPIRFNLDASHGSAMLLRHLAPLKALTQVLGARAVLDLHNKNKDAAWTNLLASSRLVTAWEPEPVEVSHLVQYKCAAIAFNITWQVLQTNGWTDDRLASLQREWESADFFGGLPETVAFARASMGATCQLERHEQMSPGELLKEMVHTPRYAWSGFYYYLRQIRYRNYGTYEDEKALLLFYRDRELELRQAVKSPTWSEMRQLPGVTNMALFKSKHSSRMQSMMNLRQFTLGLQRQGVGLLGRTAEAEARRRLIVTAIALERFRGWHGSYPQMLNELSPELLKNPPIDFMDGKPLRYRLTDDGHFILYSVGLDCIDDGGQMPSERQRVSYDGIGSFGVPQKTDLVWPRPATDAEVKAQQAEKKMYREEERKRAELRELSEEKQTEELRRAAVENILAMKSTRLKDPKYDGQPLSQVLRNEKTPAKNILTLDELLTLKQVITGQEPDIATFELPISFDAMTNIGLLRLLVDKGPEPTNDIIVAASPEGRAFDGGGELQECSRATNGDCLLIWNTTYDPPGQHALQTQLLYTDKKTGWHTSEVIGPVASFFSSNLCQFDPFYSEFDSSGAILYAKLPESNGVYTIEIKSSVGTVVRTFTGTTSNQIIKVHWDLTDEHGNRCTNNSFDTVFHITLPDSGRSQTMKGP